MSSERRKKLASLTFTEKVRLLEKLRDRSLVLAEARNKLAEKRAREERLEQQGKDQKPE